MKTFPDTFLDKLCLSTRAMFCGWIACNIAWWMGTIHIKTFQNLSGDPLGVILAIGLCTGVVIVAAWFFIFLPMDLLVPDGSPLRRPPVAALFGFLVSFALVAFYFLSRSTNSIHTYGFVEAVLKALGGSALPFVLGTCATGTVAGWTRALMDKPNSSQTP